MQGKYFKVGNSTKSDIQLLDMDIYQLLDMD